MFKPFVTGSQRGTGLGLAITQRIINAHKGKIEVDSYPGGTIFRIFLHKKKGLANQ
jgi:nitrogen-specific signal transduction histidine kinase